MALSDTLGQCLEEIEGYTDGPMYANLEPHIRVARVVNTALMLLAAVHPRDVDLIANLDRALAGVNVDALEAELARYKLMMGGPGGDA